MKRLGKKDDLRLRLDHELLHVMGLDTDSRATYLAQLAVTEPDLSDRLRRLIDETSDLPTSFLSVPAGDALLGNDGRTSAGRPAASKKSPRDKKETSGFVTPKDRYRVERLLGTGGMAKVYLARDEQLGRRVALKLLDHSDDAMRRRFQREARSQARVDHVNVLEIYETGEIERRPYIAMRYVEGCTLLDAADELNVDEKIALFGQVCEGLHAAHRKGLLHRDVKPSNVLVEENSDGFKAYVADFGIAVAEEPESTLTTAMAGTPVFIAPERLTEGETDRRCDIYSLGVTMYQIFTGELPFAGDSVVEVMRKTCSEDPKRPREIKPDLPEVVEEVILRCMAKKPEDRYGSTRAVAYALYGEEPNDEAAAGYTTGETTRTIERPSARRGILGAALGAALALIAVLVFLLVSAQQHERVLTQEMEMERRVTARIVELFEVPAGVSGGDVSAQALLDRGAFRARGEKDPLLRGRLLAEVGRMYHLLELNSEARSILGDALAALSSELDDEHPEVVRVRTELENIRR